MQHTRRAFTRLALLTTAAFSLRPTAVLACGEPLEPRFSAGVAEDGRIMLRLVADNTGQPVEVSFSRSALTIELVSGTERASISPWSLDHTAPGPLAISQRERMSRAGLRESWMTLPAGETVLAQCLLTPPEGMGLTADVRVEITVRFRVGDSDAVLHDEVSLVRRS